MKKNGKHPKNLDRLVETRIQFQTTLSPLEKWFLQKAAKKVDESLANFLRTSALDRGAGLISGPVDAHRADYLKSIKSSGAASKESPLPHGRKTLTGSPRSKANAATSRAPRAQLP